MSAFFSLLVGKTILPGGREGGLAVSAETVAHPLEGSDAFAGRLSLGPLLLFRVQCGAALTLRTTIPRAGMIALSEGLGLTEGTLAPPAISRVSRPFCLKCVNSSCNNVLRYVLKEQWLETSTENGWISFMYISEYFVFSLLTSSYVSLLSPCFIEI